MESQPIRDPRVLEALEACRPGSDDLARPELQFLAAEFQAHPQWKVHFLRIQQADRTLAAAMGDVPVPADLEARLLAALADSLSTDEATRAIAESSPPAELVAVRIPRRRFLRSWAAVGSVVAAAGILAGLTVSFWPGAPTFDRETALQEAVDVFRKDALSGLASEPAAAPRGFPLSRQVRVPLMPAWRQASLLGVRGVAYDLNHRGVAATLYVLPANVTGLSASAPTQPQRATAGFASAAWQEGDLVYILVVSGGRDDYRRFFGFNLRSGPIA